MDYWGASYTQAAAWLREQEYSKIYPCNLSFAMQYEARGAFEVVGSAEEAKYIVCDYETDLKEGYDGEIVHKVERMGVTLNIIRKASE